MPKVEEKLLGHRSTTAPELRRVGERFRPVKRILYSNNTPKSGREVPHCPIGRSDTSQLSRRKRSHLVPRDEEKLLVYGSSTATTLQRVGERFRTIPSGADRRGVNNSAAGITTARQLRERTHSRNRQQTNRSWQTLLVTTVSKKTKPISCRGLKRNFWCTKGLTIKQVRSAFVRGETTDAETCFHGGPHIHKEDCGNMHSSARHGTPTTTLEKKNIKKGRRERLQRDMS